MEDLQVDNMSKPAKETAEQHGKNVKQSLFECVVEYGYQNNADVVDTINVLKYGQAILAIQ